MATPLLDRFVHLYRARLEVRVLFHPCRPRPSEHRWIPPDLEGITLEEVWLRALSGAFGGYRPPTPEQARVEAKHTCQRKAGSGRHPIPNRSDQTAEPDL